MDRHFLQMARYWREIYQQEDVFALIHRQRSLMVLDWVDHLPLPERAHVLEVGCGSGLTAVALAKRGLQVAAIDNVPAMTEMTRRYAEECGLNERVRAAVCDCHALHYPGNSFDAAIAMGVTPFLHSLPCVLSEMARVITPGGHLIINADNRWRLTKLLDPLACPPLAPARSVVRRFLNWFRRKRAERDPNAQGLPVHMYSRCEFDRLLTGAGFEILHSSMLGYGPFTLFGKPLPNKLGVKVHQWLQRLANRGMPLLSSTGAQYMVLARKPAGPTLVHTVGRT